LWRSFCEICAFCIQYTVCGKNCFSRDAKISISQQGSGFEKHIHWIVRYLISKAMTNKLLGLKISVHNALDTAFKNYLIEKYTENWVEMVKKT